MKLNLLHYAPEDVFGLPGLDEKYQWAAIDKNGILFAECEPIAFSGLEHWSSESDTLAMQIQLQTDYTGDWRESKIQRPVTIELGVFGRFKDSSFVNWHFGYLLSVSEEKGKTEYFKTYDGKSGAAYDIFEPCDPATLPKRIEIK